MNIYLIHEEITYLWGSIKNKNVPKCNNILNIYKNKNKRKTTKVKTVMYKESTQLCKILRLHLFHWTNIFEYLLRANHCSRCLSLKGELLQRSTGKSTGVLEIVYIFTCGYLDTHIGKSCGLQCKLYMKSSFVLLSISANCSYTHYFNFNSQNLETNFYIEYYIYYDRRFKQSRRRKQMYTFKKMFPLIENNCISGFYLLIYSTKVLIERFSNVYFSISHILYAASYEFNDFLPYQHFSVVSVPNS